MELQDIPVVVEIENQCFSLPWSEKSFEDSLKIDMKETYYEKFETESYAAEK